MTVRKQLWVLAGGNGAGKSTFYRLFLAPNGIKLVNADVIACVLGAENTESFSYTAAVMAEKLREELLRRRMSFCFETVFSHVSKIDFVARAKSLGYHVVLIYIHLDHPDLNEARVFQRVLEGGHDVPADKIRARISRTIRNIAVVIPLVDEARLLDNSSRENPFHPVAIVKRGKRLPEIGPLPDWAEIILADSA